MEKILKEGSTILCGYCERNDADPKFLNLEVEEKRKTEIRGAYKYHTNLREEWKVQRCQQCYEIHQKGSNLIGVGCISTYIITYIFSCIILQSVPGGFKYFILLILAFVPTVIVGYLLTFIIGTFNARKYKIKTRWANGGDVLQKDNVIE